MVEPNDRYFMDKVVDHLLVFERTGDIRLSSNYTQCHDWKDAKSPIGEKEKRKKPPRLGEDKTAKKVRLNEKQRMSFKENYLNNLEQRTA